MNALVDQIPTSSQSELAQVFSRWRSGEISQRDYETQNALWIATNPEQYPARRYFQITSQLEDYIAARFSGSSYDQALGIKLGLWVYNTRSALHRNLADFDLIVWAIEKLMGVGAESALNRLMIYAEQYRNLDFPSQQFERACRVQALDARARG